MVITTPLPIIPGNQTTTPRTCPRPRGTGVLWSLITGVNTPGNQSIPSLSRVFVYLLYHTFLGISAINRGLSPRQPGCEDPPRGMTHLWAPLCLIPGCRDDAIPYMVMGRPRNVCQEWSRDSTWSHRALGTKRSIAWHGWGRETRAWPGLHWCVIWLGKGERFRGM